MKHCFIYALYLPSVDKTNILEEIFSCIKLRQKSSKIFIGIQYNSVPGTEGIINGIKGDLDIEMDRVPAHLMIDSDASSFIAALKLYSKSSMNFDRCYFVHTKGITSNNDPLRRVMFEEILNEETIENKLSDPKIGSYSPYLTLTNVSTDINKMSCLSRFNPKTLFHSVMEYYYINTFYVIKNRVLKSFIETVLPPFFDTHINLISDRWFFERDFLHIVDMQGYQPSFKYFHGNYSTNYRMPTMSEYLEKLNKWQKMMENEKRNNPIR